jgi:phosphoribosylamine---glycine ligase
MKILVVGSGGREHALCHTFKKSNLVSEIYCANGNAGIAELAVCIDINPEEINKLINFAVENKIDLTFVGGETSLALGIVDEFEKNNLKIIGVSKQVAQLEASKSFSKDFMARHSVPTAIYETANSAEEAVKILESGKFGNENIPIVVKADGLAAGKGVVVAQNRNDAIAAIKDLSSGKIISKDAAEKIVLEECLFGREVSLLLFADGKNFALMPPARDHKRIGEGNTGANTGGMGVITDSSLLTESQTIEIIEDIIKPTLQGAKNDGFEFRGILFLGLMMTETGAKVLEYNVRFGDPETQAILIRLETDFVEICKAIDNQTLDKLEIKWKEGSSACVVLASENYPAKPKTGDIIYGLKDAEKIKNTKIIHAGTKQDEHGNFVTSGGRVLGVTATGNNLDEALNCAYEAVKKINWNGMQYRRDIGK